MPKLIKSISMDGQAHDIIKEFCDINKISFSQFLENSAIEVIKHQNDE